MEVKVFSRISIDTNITNIVGTKIYPAYPTVDTQLPMVVYSRLSTEDNIDLANTTSLITCEYQFDCWSLTQVQANQLADAIASRIKSWRDSDVAAGFRLNQTLEEEELGYHVTLLTRIFFRV